MAKKPKAPPPKDTEDEPDERPTVVPTFDPAALARETASSSKTPGAPSPNAPTVPSGRRYSTDDPTLARPALAPDSAPPETTQMPESMRSSLLSMADSRVPSINPAPHRVPSVGGFVSPIDKGWEELTLDEPISNRPKAKPSPSDGPNRRKTSRLRAPSAEHPATGDGDRDDTKEPSTREHLVVGEPATGSTRTVPREDPSGPSRRETPEATIFSPARAAAALTAAAGRPKAVSERPAPIAAIAPALTPEDTVREMRDRFSLGDYTGALVLADGLLEDDPHNPEVKDCAENCRQVLRQMYTARIGPLDRVPVVTVARDQLRWLSIDHRAGFVLSHIDGVSSLEMILDVSGMPLLDALRILCELAQQRIISFR